MSGKHFQRVKLVDGTLDQSTAIPGGASGLYVDPHPSSLSVAVKSGTLTLTGGGNYAANDVVGQAASVCFEFANAARSSGGTGQVLTAVLTDVNATARIPGQIDLLLFSAAPASVAADNAAVDFTDAGLLKLQGTISFPAPTVTASNCYSVVQNCGIGYACDATSLYGILVARAASTALYAANDDLQIRLFCLRD